MFSVTKRLQSEWVLLENMKKIILTKGDKKIEFDTMIPTPHWSIYACYFHQRHDELGAIVIESGTKMSIQCMHENFGHYDEETTTKNVKH